MVVVEYAKSSRSTCTSRKCGKKIEKGEVRVAELESFKGRGRGRGGTAFSITKYYHLCCFPKSHLKEESLKGLEALNQQDQRCAVQTLCAAKHHTSREESPVRQPIQQWSCEGRELEDPSEWDLVPPDQADKYLLASGRFNKEFVEALLPFQKQSLHFAMERCRGRIMIADEMGLGKTVQAIGFALAFRNEWPVLIVTPSSVKLNWADELEKWIPDVEPGMVNMVKSRTFPGNLLAPVTIVTYGMFTQKSPVSKLIAEAKFKVVILDESHYIKSTAAVRTKLLTPILNSSRRLALLSGTPALAKPIELWSQVFCLRPDLFKSFKEFTQTFCAPKRLPWGMDFNGASNLHLLNSRLRQFMVRRLKRHVLLQLPEKRRQIMRLDIPSNSKALQEVKQLMKDLKGVDLNALLSTYSNEEDNPDMFREACSARNEQRKILSGLYTKTGQAKVEAAIGAINTFLLGTDDKVIIFAHHLAILDALQQELTRKKFQLMRIDGSTPVKDRHENVQAFQDPNSGIRVALLGLTSAGQGITLTAASKVVFVEMHWTPGILIQAEDRAHRIGQRNAVNVYYLLAGGTLDDIVWPMVCRKLDTVGKALDGLNRESMRATRTRLYGGKLVPSEEAPLSDDEVRKYQCTKHQASDEKKQFPNGDMRTWLSGKNLKGAMITTEPPTNVQMTPFQSQNPELLDLTDSRQSFPEVISALGTSSDRTTDLPEVICAVATSRNAVTDLSEDQPISPLETNFIQTQLAVGRKRSQSGAKQCSQSTRKKRQSTIFSFEDGDDIEDVIEDFDDETLEKPYFSVSENTGRVFLYDENKIPLHKHFSPEQLDSSDIAVNIPFKFRSAAREFSMQWLRLRAVEKKELYAEIIRPPLLSALHAKRSRSGDPGNDGRVCFDRYLARELVADQGTTLMNCLSCGLAVPESLLRAGVRLFCSQECYTKRKIKTDGATIRRQLYELERGVCQLCGVDAHSLFEEIKHLAPPERFQRLLATETFKLNAKLVDNPTEGDFWQADHIVAVAVGGGQCGLENFRTLCTPCHARETAKLIQTLKVAKLREVAAGTKDIRRFFLPQLNN